MRVFVTMFIIAKKKKWDKQDAIVKKMNNSITDGMITVQNYSAVKMEKCMN